MPTRKSRPDDEDVAGLPTHRVPLNAKGQPICGAANKRDGSPCQMSAGHGTDHPGFGTCKFHGGALPEHQSTAARQEVLAIVDEKKALGLVEPDADPDEVMMQEVGRAKAAVEYFDGVVKEMTDDPEVDPAGARFQKVVWHWNEQRRLLTNVSNIVVKAGIAKRHVEIQEIQAAAILTAIIDVVQSPEVGMEPEQTSLVKRMLAGKLRELTTVPEERMAVIDVAYAE